jgi:hypothetical protein
MSHPQSLTPWNLKTTTHKLGAESLKSPQLNPSLLKTITLSQSWKNHQIFPSLSCVELK